MNICFASLNYPMNGAATSGVGSQVQLLAHSLIEAGHSVSVIDLTDNEELTVTDDRGVEVYRLRSSNLHWFAGKLPLVGKALALPIREIEYSIAVWRGARRANKVRKVNLIEGTETGMLLVSMFSGKTPTIIRLHGEKYTFHKYTPGMGLTFDVRLSRVLQRVAMRCAKVLISPSVAHAREIASELPCAETLLRVIPNTTYTSELQSRCAPADPPAVLFVGRLERVKGVEVLLEAAAMVVKQVPHARFVLAGGSHPTLPANNLNAMIRNDSLQNNVVQLGHLPKRELDVLYRKARLCVVPSHYESFGLVALEAMAAGLPVVGTRTGGLPEVIEDGKTGLLVAPGDASELAAAITTLLTDPARAEEMGTAARERVANRFSIAATVLLNLSLYEEMCASQCNENASTSLREANVSHVS
jgi:glycogen synthase